MVDDNVTPDVPEAPSPPERPAERQPVFGKKLIVGKYIADIQAGPHPDQFVSDVKQLFMGVGAELRAIRDVLVRAGFINSQGVVQIEGSVPSGGTQNFYPNWNGGDGCCDGLWDWFEYWNPLLIRLQTIIKWLWLNKQEGGFAAEGYHGHAFQRHEGFHKGKFYGDMVLDAVSDISMTLPGTIDTGVLPASTKFWQNRIFADLKNGRVYVATEPGDDESFFTVGEVVWKYVPGTNRIDLDDPQTLGPTVSFAAAAGLVFPSSFANGMLKTDGSGNIVKTSGGLGVAGQVLISGTDWSNPVFQDNLFAIKNNATPSKRVVVSASNVSASMTRTIEMPDRDFQKEEHMYVGASAPTAAEGQLWYKTSDNCLYVYESTRSKWLSVSEHMSTMFTHTGAAAANTLLQLPQGILCGGTATGEWMLWDGTITGAWFAAKAVTGGNRTFTFYKNGANTGISMTMANGTRFISNTSGDIDFSAGDYVSIVLGAGGVNQPHGRVLYRRRTS